MKKLVPDPNPNKISHNKVAENPVFGQYLQSKIELKHDALNLKTQHRNPLAYTLRQADIHIQAGKTRQARNLLQYKGHPR